MDILKQYKISFSGLQVGDHEFDFQIDDKFFESFENSRIHQCQLDLKLWLHKQSNMLQFNFHFIGEVQTECDRCLDPLGIDLDFNEILLVKFGRETFEESESILVLDEKEHEVDLSQYIYEFISLSLPMQLVHPDGENGESTCNPEFLESFNDNHPVDEPDIDPRWEALNKLIKK